MSEINTTSINQLYLYGEQDPAIVGGYIDFGSFLNQNLSGDFDVQIDFNGITTSGYDIYTGLGVSTTNDINAYTGLVIGITIENVGLDTYYTTWYDWTQQITTDTSGKLRITREIVADVATFDFYYWSAGWQLLSSIPVDIITNPEYSYDMYAHVVMEVTDNANEGAMNFTNFKINSGELKTGINASKFNNKCWRKYLK